MPEPEALTPDARATTAVRLLASAPRSSPLHDLGPGGWDRHSLLLVPAGRAAADLPPHLRSLVAGDPHAAVRAAPVGRWRPGSGPSAPYAVLLSRIVTSRPRLRAFPLDGGGSGGSGGWTLDVHGRRRRSRGRLGVAGRTQRAAAARCGRLVVPQVLAWGRSAGGEWLAEELVQGRHVKPHELAGAAAAVTEGLAAHWEATGLHARRRRTPPGRAAEVVALLASPHALVQDLHRVRAAVRSLGSTTVRMAVGACHGDPVVGNVFVAPDGRPVLLDWEHAGPGLVARDVVKAVLGVPDPEQAWDLLAGTGAGALSPGGLGASPWRTQVAVTLVDWLSTWRQDRGRHDASGRSGPFRRRLQRRVALLERVLAG